MLPQFLTGRPAREADLALKAAAIAETQARKCAVLWFGEILRRKLYLELGYSSMPQYARRELGFSETRISDFMRLSRKLDQLPAVKAALPEIGYTKAREIVEVASPRTEDHWVAEAKNSTRARLAARIKQVKAARSRPTVGLFAPDIEQDFALDLGAEIPVRVALEFTPEQHARWEMLWERLMRRGVSGGRAEVLLEAMLQLADSAGDFPRGKSDPAVRIHVHQCSECGKAETGGRALGPADRERVHCDAVVAEPGKRATSTIPPRTRNDVLARDRHRCQAPGCGRRRFLEVHHMKPRARGGAHEPANLITLCAACHRLWHERC